jgi:hypothetical protein
MQTAVQQQCDSSYKQRSEIAKLPATVQAAVQTTVTNPAVLKPTVPAAVASSSPPTAVPATVCNNAETTVQNSSYSSS